MSNHYDRTINRGFKVYLEEQGGGVTHHDGVETYVDLIVGDLTSIATDYPQTLELFEAFAKYRQGASNFGYAEIKRDNRLKNSLSKTEEGAKLFEKLQRNIPLITVSNDILGNTKNIKNVKIFSLSDLEKDPLRLLEKIQNATHLETISDKNTFLDGIERLNKILSIKPGFFGVSININEVIDGWIKKKRKNMQLSPSS